KQEYMDYNRNNTGLPTQKKINQDILPEKSDFARKNQILTGLPSPMRKNPSWRPFFAKSRHASLKIFYAPVARGWCPPGYFPIKPPSRHPIFAYPSYCTGYT